MYPNKILIFITLLILMLSGLNGFFIEQGLLNINPSFLSVLLDGSLFIVAIFSSQNIKQFRTFTFIFLFFLFFSLITNVLNPGELNATIYLNGLRDFLPYFLFPIIFLNFFHSSWKSFFIKKFNTLLYIFLAFQIPVSLYQFSMNGAGDMVGGTQGTGFSGILTFIIFLTTYYLMTIDFDEHRVFKSIIKKSYLFLFWLPAFINETKISFLLIILFILLLTKVSVSNIRKTIFVTIGLIPLLFLFETFYKSTTENSITTDFLNEEFLDRYMMGEEDVSSDDSDIPRFQKIAIYLAQSDIKEILFGKGVGQFKGGTTVASTPFSVKYDWLLQGSRPMSFFLLVQVGIIGMILFIWYWFSLINLRKRKLRVNYSTNLIIYTTICFIIIQLYNDSLRSFFFCGVIFYVLCYAISQRKVTKKEWLRVRHSNYQINRFNTNDINITNCEE